MKRSLLVMLGVSSFAACTVSPPEPDSAAFRCDTDDDCAADFICLTLAPETPKVCVRDVTCGPGDCPDGFTCTGQPARCWPPGSADGPCASAPCAGELVCLEDPALANGFRCASCEELGCPASSACVQLSASSWGCRPKCMTDDDCPAPPPALCGWVSGADMNADGIPDPAQVCVPCPLGCDLQSCQVEDNPAGPFVPLDQASSCSCTDHTPCGGGRCVQQSASQNVCAASCILVGESCALVTGTGAETGWCTEILSFNGSSEPTCVHCGLSCNSGLECRVATNNPARLDNTVRECVCVDALCAGIWPGNHCDASATTCTNACTADGDCLPPYLCDPGATICAEPQCNHDGNPDPLEVCDDGAGGWCKDDCTGPTPEWGLVFGFSTGAMRNVGFATHDDFNVEPDFTIELWLRILPGTSALTTVLDRGGGGGNPGYRLSWLSNALTATFTDGSNSVNITANNIQPNTSHKIGVVRSSATTFTLYVDGNQRDTETVPAFGGVTISNNWPLTLGGVAEEPNSSFAVDELRLWTVARTQTQLAGERVGHSLFGEPGLVGEWLFDYALAPFGSGDIVDTSPSSHPPPTLTGAGEVTGGIVP